MSNTAISREQLRTNRTMVKLSELHLWEQNPREVIDLKRVTNDMKGLQTVPLLVMSDGTILGGNSRYQGMLAAGKKDVWVSVVEFDAENGKYIPYINGERDIKEFNSISDGMTHYALKNNQEYARYLEDEVIELTQDSMLDFDEYTLRDDSGELLSLKDIMGVDDSVQEEEKETTEETTDKPTAKKDPKITYTITFPMSHLSATDDLGFEEWLKGQMDELMLSMLDQFKKAKDVE